MSFCLFFIYFVFSFYHFIFSYAIDNSTVLIIFSLVHFLLHKYYTALIIWKS